MLYSRIRKAEAIVWGKNGKMCVAVPCSCTRDQVELACQGARRAGMAIEFKVRQSSSLKKMIIFIISIYYADQASRQRTRQVRANVFSRENSTEPCRGDIPARVL